MMVMHEVGCVAYMHGVAGVEGGVKKRRGVKGEGGRTEPPDNRECLLRVLRCLGTPITQRPLGP